MNSFYGIISTQFKNTFKQAIDELIRGCQVPCRVYYPITKYTDCTNCNSLISTASPNPFLAGNKGKLTTSCSYCGGTGKIPSESYDDINLCVLFNYKNNREIVPGIIVTPDGDAKTLSKIETIDKIKECKYIVFDTNIESLNKHKFIRDGEPLPLGLGDNSYIITTWKIGG